MIHVNHRVVLNASLITDADVVHVTANGHMRPNAGAFTNHHIANNFSTGIDICGGGNAWHGPAKFSNHGK